MATTVIEVFTETVRQHGACAAMRVRRGETWLTTTWAEYGELAHQVARGFMALGLQPRGGVVILGANRPEWFLADLGAILAGGVPAGIYSTSSADQCRYISEHCDAAVAVVENLDQLTKLKAMQPRPATLKAIVLMEGRDPSSEALAWDDLLERGRHIAEADLEARKAAARGDDLCTLIYTSGTTGPPKAVMMTHRNFTWTAQTLYDHVPGFGPDDSMVCYLPLSHVAEQLLSIHMLMRFGGCAWFEPDLARLGDTLRACRPSVFLGVPRVWEKIQARIMDAGARNKGLKKAIARWARRVGLEGGRALQRGEKLPFGFGLADRLVFSKVRAQLGLDRCRMAVSSTAPISLDTLEFFLSLGVIICEVYGMSECTGPGSISTPSRFRTGKAGYPLPGTELRIAEDGEVCMRGPHVFAGYLKDEEATRQAKDADGWLHSGDIGTLDEDGFLKITDRKKELIITAGGKNISPALIESALKGVPVIAQAVVIGDRRRFLSALVTLNVDRIPDEARTAGCPEVTTPEAAAASSTFTAHLLSRIEEASRSLSRVETVRRVAILPHELSEQGGELTPTMKLKRRVIEAKYAALIEGLYQQPA